MMAAGIILVGTGLLADYSKEFLSETTRVTRCRDLKEIPTEAELVLVLDDTWHPHVFNKAIGMARKAGIPLLRGGVSFGTGVIGPISIPEHPGCTVCADHRRLMAGRDRKEMLELQMKHALLNELPCDPWGSRNGLLHMALMIEKEVKQFLQEKSIHLQEHIYMINLQTMETSKHFFLADPQCPVCGNLPVDSPELAEITMHSTPKINSGYRSRPLEAYKAVLPSEYLDFRTGVMNGIFVDHSLPFADVIVNLPLFGNDEGVAGRSHSYVDSEATALLEGLERYCGIGPRGKKRAVCDSYEHLKNIAINPKVFGLHEEKWYELPHFPFRRFDPHMPINWVWGYSFLQNRAILVPELLAYYSLGDGQGFVYETSNGCAIGGSLEEAIFHGILEIVERDSFLITWYAQLPLTPLDLHSANDSELELMVDRLREAAGYDVSFYNSTMEHEIPSVWGIAKNRNSSGLNLICAAGANPDPVKAVKSAMFELAGMMHRHDEKLEKNRLKYERMLADPYAVVTMEDHGMLYGLPEAEERLRFLLAGERPPRTFAEEFKQQRSHTDLKEDLLELLNKFRGLNLEVIVVDQSTPVTRRNGLFCVKVLIPGMLPMTFGHHLTRIRGLERVLNVPMKLGFTSKPLTFEQLNHDPHPFP